MEISVYLIRVDSHSHFSTETKRYEGQYLKMFVKGTPNVMEGDVSHLT